MVISWAKHLTGLGRDKGVFTLNKSLSNANKANDSYSTLLHTSLIQKKASLLQEDSEVERRMLLTGMLTKYYI